MIMTSYLFLLHSAVTNRLSALLLISLLCSLSHGSSACLPTASCSPPDLAALHSIAAALPPPLFTRWQLAAARNVCCGQWDVLTITCSSCPGPTTDVTHNHTSGVGRVTGFALDDFLGQYVQGIEPVRFPVALCALSALTSLRLTNNHFIFGTMPECIGNKLTHLVHLDLSSNSLTGSIPLSFSRLSSLQHLSLSSNSLTGSIPLSFSRLSSLQYLDLSSNSLTDSIPLSFSRLSSLQYLDLSYNSLSGAFPPLNPSHLASLYLHDNSFSGSIPSPLNLTQLTSLSLKGNALSGPLPILNTPNLVSVDFSDNHISGSLSPLFQASNLSSLRFMSISDNQLQGMIPDFDPFHLSSLVSQIDFSSNLLSGSLPESICGFTSLSILDLSSNAFSGHMNTLEKCNFSNLGVLDLSTNLFTGPFPDWSRSASNLSSLSLAHNNLSGSLPNGWRNLTLLSYVDLSDNSVLVPSENPTEPKLPCWLFALSHLQEMHLSSMQLQTTDLVGICSSAYCGAVSLHLNVLDLSNNLLNASILPCNLSGLLSAPVFVPVINLERTIYFTERAEPVLNLSGNPLKLDLSNPDVVKLLPKSLATLDLSACMLRGHLTKLFFDRLAPSLTQLFLAHNQLEGQIPGELGNMSQLNTVDLSYNFFTGLSPLTNGGLGPFDLYLSNNNLTGSLSSLLLRIVANNMSLCIEDRHINNLDLSHNMLSGDIPPFLFQCLSDDSTQRLKLNHNNLHGSLPNVPFPRSLVALSLSNNQLSGQIPSSFRNLTWLSLLDLSHNKFEGNVETIALFSNASLGQRFPKLRVLLMGSNNFTGSIPASLGDIVPALQLIDLSNNHLIGSIPVHALQSLPAFKTLYLPLAGFYVRYNLDVLDGILYEEISIKVKGREETYPYVLQALTALDLSGNELSGPIPIGMGELSGLVYLDLSRNNLTGPLPSDLGMLGGQLEALDLSFNEFVGPIPSSFKNLTGLAVFNISYNEGLSGPILQTPQFDNKDSYIGNPKLCSSGQEHVLPNACPNLLKGKDPTISSQEEPHKKMNSFKRWINEWIDIRGFSLCTVVGFLGTLWALKRWYL